MKTSTPDAPRRLVVLAPNWLGDAVMALPLLADLRRAWPGTDLIVAARAAVSPLYAMVSGVSATVSLESSGGWRAIPAAERNVAHLRGGDFDASVLLPNSFISAWLVWRAGIPERWGFARDLRGRLLTRVLPRPVRYGHQVEYYQAIASGLGLPTGAPHASLTVHADSAQRATSLLNQHGVTESQPYAALAPGAAYGRAKQWLPERFTELTRLLAAQRVATVLVGAKGDAHACREVAARSRQTASAAQVIDLCGQTDLMTLAALFKRANHVVANDSGAMHLAAAVGAPVTAVFGPTDNIKTAPLKASAHSPSPRIVSSDVWCRPCMLRECPIDHRCMHQITAEQVFAELSR